MRAMQWVRKKCDYCQRMLIVISFLTFQRIFFSVRLLEFFFAFFNWERKKIETLSQQRRWKRTKQKIAVSWVHVKCRAHIGMHTMWIQSVSICLSLCLSHHNSPGDESTNRKPRVMISLVFTEYTTPKSRENIQIEHYYHHSTLYLCSPHTNSNIHILLVALYTPPCV